VESNVRLVGIRTGVARTGLVWSLLQCALISVTVGF